MFINVELSAIRALIADCVPVEAQNRASTFQGLMQGFAFVSCNVVMLVMYELNQDIKYVEIYPVMSDIAACLTLLLLLPTLLVGKET